MGHHIAVPLLPGPQLGSVPGTTGFVQFGLSGTGVSTRVHGHASVTPFVNAISSPEASSTTCGLSLRESIFSPFSLIVSMILSYTLLAVGESHV